MRTRESGVAHVNIFFFLLVLVLFLGALFFAYVQMDKNTQLENSIASIKAENSSLTRDKLIRDQYIESIVTLGETGEFAGKAGFNWESLGGLPPALQNVPSMEKIQSLAKTFARDAAIPESTILPLSSLLSQTKQALDTKVKEVGDLQTQRDKLAVEKTEAEKARTEAVAVANAENAKINQAQSELRQYIDTEIGKAQQTIAGLRSQVTKGREELTTVRDEHNKVVEGFAREANMMKARIDNMRQTVALVNPPDQPDGKVISSSQSVGRAWIDIGRKQMLPLGTVFKITAPGKSAMKAQGTVVKVESDRAEIEISGVRDRFDPVVAGDLIANDLYSPSLRRNIYLMGRFSEPYHKPEVKRILENLGNKVLDQLGPQVDLVLVGGDVLNEEADGFVAIEETDEYKRALSLNIEVANIHKVRDFLKLGQ
jgi:hypothetical protein